MNYYRWGSWLFLLGSSFFTFDAIGLTLEELTFSSSFYLIGCILFTLGCICFILDAQ
ncbi:hypothetical protein [Dactylococcopsis salina]|uniref:Uncharacterized protein n=1 Tax=Dactylococcopsis salina (strain PCC 8305) TaxID=13035 RepID=K9YYL9_DACS8|nr:hypothetical protein [Dactylococcopsis salina]AFZ52024.1 hypothetical protein Dacsa_3538 [Dactylococcopsis salina PCC 8305]